MPCVRRIVDAAESSVYRFESIVLGVASSEAFRKREGPASSGQAAVE
jgi:hypothetical protein